MDSAESTAAENRPYRYHRWGETVIRDRGILDAEALTVRGWAETPYAIDALTGMGEDPYSCGEFADAISESEAAEIAEARGLSLTMDRVDPEFQRQSLERSKVPGRPVPGWAWRWLPARARRRIYGR